MRWREIVATPGFPVPETDILRSVPADPLRSTGDTRWSLPHRCDADISEGLSPSVRAP